MENEALTVNGRNLLAFDAPLTWEIKRVQGAGVAAGGLFNMTIKGTGWVAVTAHGTPVLLDTSQMPTFADGQSAVCWSADLHVGVNRTMKAGALIGAFRAGRKSVSTPRCNSMPWPRNQQPPRAARTGGLGISAKPSTPT